MCNSCNSFLSGIWSPSGTPQPLRRQFSHSAAASEQLQASLPSLPTLPPPQPPMPVWKPSRSADPSPVPHRRALGSVRFESPSPQLGRINSVGRMPYASGRGRMTDLFPQSTPVQWPPTSYNDSHNNQIPGPKPKISLLQHTKGESTNPIFLKSIYLW